MTDEAENSAEVLQINTDWSGKTIEKEKAVNSETIETTEYLENSTKIKDKIPEDPVPRLQEKKKERKEFLEFQDLPKKSQSAIKQVRMRPPKKREEH